VVVPLLEDNGVGRMRLTLLVCDEAGRLRYVGKTQVRVGLDQMRSPDFPEYFEQKVLSYFHRLHPNNSEFQLFDLLGRVWKAALPQDLHLKEYWTAIDKFFQKKMFVQAHFSKVDDDNLSTRSQLPGRLLAEEGQFLEAARSNAPRTAPRTSSRHWAISSCTTKSHSQSGARSATFTTSSRSAGSSPNSSTRTT
jgi:hypothetical protein